MHFLLVLLRLVLDRLMPTWRDGLSMAARADGRIEHIPTRSALWDCWLRFTGQAGAGKAALRGRHPRGNARADRRPTRSRQQNTE
jgi:hypothetical protein